MGETLSHTVTVLSYLVPVALWCVFWLFAVNWRKAWPVLGQGAWVAVILLGYIVTLAWSRLDPRTCECLGVVSIPNFWWQLGDVALLIGLALFCGWLQGVLGTYPPEVSLEPVPASHDDHAHGHGHH